MTPLRRMFQSMADLFWGEPWLFVPVLMAEFCRYFAWFAATSLRRAMVLSLSPRSVLGAYGGPEEHLPMLPVAAVAAVRTAPCAIGIFVYLYAMGVLARAVPQVQSGTPARKAVTWIVPSKLGATYGVILLILTVCLSVLIFVMGVLRMQTPGTMNSLAFIAGIIFLFTIIGPLRRFMNANGPSQNLTRKTKLTDFALLVFGFGLSEGCGYVLRYVSQRDEDIARLSHSTVFGVFVSLSTALPLVAMTIGLAAVTDPALRPHPDETTVH